MKSEELLNAIGEIRDSWIDDAYAKARRRHRLPVIVAAVLLCMTLTVSALAAADVEGVYEMLYAISPAIAQALKPVQMSCVDDGIELTVVSADVDGDTARVLVGLRDLDGNRVDGTCDLYNSYQINLPSDTVSGCTFFEFDEETRTALFLVEIARADGKSIEGDKLTFSLREFLSGTQEYRGDVNLDLTQAQQNPETRKVQDAEIRGSSAAGGFDPETISEIIDSDRVLFEPVEGVTVTGMGYVNGLLHIQIHYANAMENDAHGYISLKDENGAESFGIGSISVRDEEGAGYYDELVFDISPESLAVYQPFGYFRSADSLHCGEWDITFPLK